MRDTFFTFIHPFAERHSPLNHRTFRFQKSMRNQHPQATSGGCSKVWKGAGLGTVHSSPSAPSHGLVGASAR
jgi:hypothetical protein